MSTRYTDIENTGVPAAPITGTEMTETLRQESLEEEVWSHRCEPDRIPVR